KRVVFDNPLKIEGSYVRVRDEGDKITCTYKETKSGILDITSVSELETEVGDFNEMVNIFKKLGLKSKSYQEMYREIWKINDEIEFMIDLWPGLKPYIEIEGENEEIVRKYSLKLGFNFDDGVFGSSFQIYEKELGIDFDTMNSLEEITFDNIPRKI
ncbi:CYTH domain-containing protein, partial [Candidatus Gracilibacteria bacterium]|nr:CYTH domain-containing protein [Candidatus Gracilibacteria bacterium]